VNLAVLVYSVMVPVKFLSFYLFSFLDSLTGPIVSNIELSSLRGQGQNGWSCTCCEPDKAYSDDLLE
jgi:hypothetical protein